MSSKYIARIPEEKKTDKKSKKLDQKSIIYTKKNKGKFTKKDVEDMNKELQIKAKKDKARYIIRVVSSLGLFTVKGLRTPLNVLDEDEQMEVVWVKDKIPQFKDLYKNKKK